MNNAYGSKIIRFGLIVSVLLFVLSACNEKNEVEEVDGIKDSVTSEQVNGVQDEAGKEKTETAVPTSSDKYGTSNLAECEGIRFEKDAIIDGNQLAPCIMAAMLEVETGTHKVATDDGTSTIVDFQFTPEFSLSADNGDTIIIVNDSEGWMKMPSGKWFSETDVSDDPDVLLASNTIKLTRVFAHPNTITQFLALTPSWKVVEESKVPAEDAFVDTAWQLVPNEPVVMEGTEFTNVELWITDDYLGAYYTSTAKMMGMSATSSDTFMQWGEPVTIVNPMES